MRVIRDRIYNIDILKNYKTDCGRTVIISNKNLDINSPNLLCVDFDTKDEFEIHGSKIQFDQSEVQELPFLIYKEKKIELRRQFQKLITTGKLVEVLSFDYESKKILCKNPDGTQSLYDPFIDWEGFQSFADEFVKNQKIYYPKIHFFQDGTGYTAIISSEFLNNKAMINGEWKTGKIIGDTQDKKKLSFLCDDDDSDNVLITLDQLENGDEIKKKAIDYYNNKFRSNEINYETDSQSNSQQENNMENLTRSMNTLQVTPVRHNRNPISPAREPTKILSNHFSDPDLKLLEFDKKIADLKYERALYLKTLENQNR